jgi:phosphoadenosine phosphosulfate reductase
LIGVIEFYIYLHQQISMEMENSLKNEFEKLKEKRLHWLLKQISCNY